MGNAQYNSIASMSMIGLVGGNTITLPMPTDYSVFTNVLKGTLRKANAIGFGWWLFNELSIEAGGDLTEEQLEYIALQEEKLNNVKDMPIEEQSLDFHVFPLEEPDTYIIVDFEEVNQSIIKDISIENTNYKDNILTNPIEQNQDIGIKYSNEVYGNGGFLTPQQQNKAYSRVLNNKDVRFKSKALAEGFVKTKLKDLKEEVAQGRSAEGWHYDSHPINESEQDIEHINAYSKKHKFRVHITWE